MNTFFVSAGRIVHRFIGFITFFMNKGRKISNHAIAISSLHHDIVTVSDICRQLREFYYRIRGV